MEHSPSQLEQFLQNQTSVGVSEGEGQFTLAREKALLKLAEFQLPFRGAWAVKVFQSLIADGTKSPIEVEQTRRVTTLRCRTECSYDLDTLEAAYFNPEPSKLRSLKHLTSALWSIGVNEKRGFQLTLPGHTTTLFWDGETLQKREVKPSPDFVLSVTHQSPKGLWVLNQLEAGRANSDVSKALSDYCFTSPVPLSVDKRRLDGLHNCPGHGWSNRTFPLALAFADGDLPQVTWPCGTFDTLDQAGNNDLQDGCGLEGLTKKSLKSVPKVSRSGVAVFVTAQAERSGPNNFWTIRRASSKCYWIQDGAKVQEDAYSVQDCGCSVATYVSADGLLNDLTGFYLSGSAERDRRKREAAYLATKPLRELKAVAVKTIKRHNKARYWKLGNACLLLAFGVGWYVPFVGPPTAALIGFFGLFARFATRAEEKKFLDDLCRSLNELDRSWR